MDSKEIRRRQQVTQAFVEAEGAVGDVIRRVTDGNLDAALHAMADALALTDALGEAYTVSHWPTCIGCRDAGSAEVSHPTEQDGRPSRCIDAKDRCAGNFYGRMHPVQLHDFIVKLMKDKAYRQEANRVQAELDSGRVRPVDDMKPTVVESPEDRLVREEVERTAAAAVKDAEKEAEKALGKRD